MSTYKVVEASVTKTDVGQYNNSEITATLENDDGKQAEVTFLQKPESKVPEPGDILEGTVGPTKYGLRFRKEWKQDGGGGSGGGYGASPNRDEEISRAVAVKSATSLVAAQISAGTVKDDQQAVRVLAEFTERIFDVITNSAKPEAPEGKAPEAKSDDDIPF